MEAIRIKRLASTKTKGLRVRATEFSGTFTETPWCYAASAEDNYRHCAKELCKKMNWTGRMEWVDVSPKEFLFMVH